MKEKEIRSEHISHQNNIINDNKQVASVRLREKQLGFGSLLTLDPFFSLICCVHHHCCCYSIPSTEWSQVVIVVVRTALGSCCGKGDGCSCRGFVSF